VILHEFTDTVNHRAEWHFSV